MTKTVDVIKKVCLVGTGGVGKTSLIKRYILEIFDDRYLKTLGTKVSKKEIVLEYPEKDLNITLTMLIWDIMGQETFRPLLQESYFYGAGGCLAVCDSTRAETLKSLSVWIESLNNTAGKLPLIILANKSDLKDNIKVDEETLKSFAAKYDAPYFYTSAKTGSNVEETFQKLGRCMAKDII